MARSGRPRRKRHLTFLTLCTWYALHVETPEESLRKISPSDFRILLDNINLATDLGAEFTWLESSDVVRTITDFAREKGIAKIILKRPRTRFWNQFYRSTAERLFQEARDFDIEAVSDER
jgi:K+-sensing histidine kinase KdpD